MIYEIFNDLKRVEQTEPPEVVGVTTLEEAKKIYRIGSMAKLEYRNDIPFSKIVKLRQAGKDLIIAELENGVVANVNLLLLKEINDERKI